MNDLNHSLGIVRLIWSSQPEPRCYVRSAKHKGLLGVEDVEGIILLCMQDIKTTRCVLPECYHDAADRIHSSLQLEY